MYYDYIKDLVTLLLVFIPPLILYCRVLSLKNRHGAIMALICILYCASLPFLQNAFPAMAVIMTIIAMKKFSIQREFHGSAIKNELGNDYDTLGFNIKGINFAKALSYALGTYFFSIILSLVTVFILKKMGIKVDDQDVVKILKDSDLKSFLLMIPVAVIFAPIVEEFVFRYLIFQKILKKKSGIYIAAIVSSLLFGLVHYNLKAFIPIAFIGLMNCYLIEKEGYWYSVFNHMMFNLVPIVSMLILKLMGKTII